MVSLQTFEVQVHGVQLKGQRELLDGQVLKLSTDLQCSD